VSRSTDKDARIDAIVVDGVRYESEDQAVYGTGVTTEDHRYWNATDQAWQESQHLDRGDLLMTLDGVIVSVEGLDWSNAHTALAYDLNIAGIDTFYVGVGGASVLVHNVDECEFIDLVRPDRREHILTGQVGTAADGSTFYSGCIELGLDFLGRLSSRAGGLTIKLSTISPTLPRIQDLACL
jgi:hypothetical protein